MLDMIEEQDIRHLARLARIRLNTSEVSALQHEISDIVTYVSAIKALTTDAVVTKQLGDRGNVFRADEITVAEGDFTDALLREAPETQDGYLAVKKILNQE